MLRPRFESIAEGETLVEQREITTDDVDRFLHDMATQHPELKPELYKALVADARNEFIFAKDGSCKTSD